MPRTLTHLSWLAAVLVLFGTGAAVSAQTTGTTGTGTTGPTTPKFRPFPKVGSSTTGTTPGTTTPGGTGGSVGGSTGGGFGFGRQPLLTPEQELAVLLDTLTTVETLLNSGDFQASSELEILFLLFMVYESKYAEAVQGVIASGTGSGTGNGSGSGTGSGTPPGG